MTVGGLGAGRRTIERVVATYGRRLISSAHRSCWSPGAGFSGLARALAICYRSRPEPKTDLPMMTSPARALLLSALLTAAQLALAAPVSAAEEAEAPKGAA